MMRHEIEKIPVQIFSVTAPGPAPFAADDRIFLGEGLFETVRIHNQKPHYAQLHWQRMRDSASLLNIQFELSYDAWHAALEKCIQDAPIITGGVKVILSGGRAVRGLTTQGQTPCLLFSPFAYSATHEACRLVSASWLRDPNNPIYRLKSINYLESILARKQAVAAGADDALFFNVFNHATETTTANLFTIKNDHVFTPGLASGVLAGITRSRLLSLCAMAGVPCTEQALDKEATNSADAVFVTNALQGIRLVKSLDAVSIPACHPLVIFLQDLWRQDDKN